MQLARLIIEVDVLAELCDWGEEKRDEAAEARLVRWFEGRKPDPATRQELLDMFGLLGYQPSSWNELPIKEYGTHIGTLHVRAMGPQFLGRFGSFFARQHPGRGQRDGVTNEVVTRVDHELLGAQLVLRRVVAPVTVDWADEEAVERLNASLAGALEQTGSRGGLDAVLHDLAESNRIVLGLRQLSAHARRRGEPDAVTEPEAHALWEAARGHVNGRGQNLDELSPMLGTKRFAIERSSERSPSPSASCATDRVTEDRPASRTQGQCARGDHVVPAWPVCS